MTAEIRKLLISFTFTLLILQKVHCEESVIAKVAELPENSTVTFIRHTGNGYFYPSSNKTVPINQVASNEDQRMIGQCGGIYRNLQNLIESPKFISARPICNLRCEYQIVSPYICENEFHVQFLDFAIDSSPECENDRVIINYSEVLCGRMVGVKKFRSESGVLNITFTSRTWDLKQGRGFRMLITRLPCVEVAKEAQTEIDSLEPTAQEEDRCFQVGSSYNVTENRPQNEGHPIYGVPVAYNRTRLSGRQDIPVLPLPIPPPRPPFYPPTIPPYPGQPNLPPQYLPQCCRNTFNQQRFLVISQGFPAYRVKSNDCIFVIQRSSPNVCRLKIVFKYFLLDDPQPNQFGCVNNFVEIDGQRICGCKTNFIYETLWGYEPKVLRLRTMPGSFSNAQGFIMDVIQEPCPFKVQDNMRLMRPPRFIKPEKLSFHPLPSKNQESSFGLMPAIRQFKTDIDEKFKSKFFQPQPKFINNVCVMNHLKLFQLKLESLGLIKHYCINFNNY